MGLKCDTCYRSATHTAYDTEPTTNDYPIKGTEILPLVYLGCDEHPVKAGRVWFDVARTLSSIYGIKGLKWD